MLGKGDEQSRISADEAAADSTACWPPEKLAYLAQIQGVVNRMASVSATCKGFTVTMFAGVLAIVLSVGQGNRLWAIGFVIVLVLLLSVLDGYYFAKELQYRDLYDDVLTGAHPCDLDMKVEKSGIPLKRVVGSLSIWAFYGSFLICCAVLAILASFGIIS